MSIQPPPHDREHEVSLQGIDLVELETFIAVAESGSFSAAAQRLHVAQPSVTGRVQRLETALGTKLLERTTRKVETTADGAMLLAQAKFALRGLREIVGKFREGARLARQRVVIASTPMVAAFTLPPIIHAYMTRYHDVQIELRDLQYRDAINALDAGTVDLAVLSLDAADSRFQFEALWTRNMVLVAPSGHAFDGRTHMGVDELADVQLTIVEQYQPVIDRIALALKERGLRLKPPRTVSNLNTLLGLLDAGMGVTLLPRSAADRDAPTKHTVVEIDDIDLTREFGIALPKNANLGTAATSFCQFLREAVRH